MTRRISWISLFFRHGSLAVLLFLGLALTGCAARLPGTSVMPEERRTEIMAGWQQSQSRGCPTMIDADFSLRWDSLTERGSVAARLLLRDRACKVTVITPLGQPLLIFSTDGDRFRLARVQDGRGYEGSTSSRAWQRYLPGDLAAAGLGDWLAGRTDPRRPVAELRRDDASALAWITLRSPRGSELFLFDPDTSTVRRRLLLDSGDTVLLDVEYVWSGSGDGCDWPHEIRVRGGGFTTELTLRLKRWAAPARLDDAALDFAFPPNYLVEVLE